jgi:hypothetical protein
MFDEREFGIRTKKALKAFYNQSIRFIDQVLGWESVRTAIEIYWPYLVTASMSGESL